MSHGDHGGVLMDVRLVGVDRYSIIRLLRGGIVVQEGFSM